MEQGKISVKSERNTLKKSKFLSLKDKAEIIDRLDSGITASQLARDYGVAKSTVSRFKKRKKKIQEAVTTIYKNNTDRKSMRSQFHPKMELALYQWYTEQREQSIDVTGIMIREKAQYYYLQFQESKYSFSASSGWLSKFQKRFGIRFSGDKVQGTQKPNDTMDVKNLVNPGAYGTENEDPLSVNWVCDNHGRDQQNVVSSGLQSRRVDSKEAVRCLDTVIKWSTENSIDSLYLTMLRSLKNRAKNGPRK